MLFVMYLGIYPKKSLFKWFQFQFYCNFSAAGKQLSVAN